MSAAPAHRNGHAFAALVAHRFPNRPVVVVTGHVEVAGGPCTPTSPPG